MSEPSNEFSAVARLPSVRIAVVAVAAAVLYAVSGLPQLRLVIVAAAIGIVAGLCDRRTTLAASRLTVAVAWMLAFLVMPLWPHMLKGWSPLAANTVLGLAGAAWLCVIFRYGGPFSAKLYTPSWCEAAIVVVAVLMVYSPGWDMDMAYRGDESFHFGRIVFFRGLVLRAETAWLLAWLLVMLGLGLWALLQPERSAFLVSVPLISALLGPVVFGHIELSGNLHAAYAARYPNLQVWLSAVLVMLAPESWQTPPDLTLMLLRLLPLLWLLLLLFALSGDHRWRKAPFGVTALACLTIAGVPTILHHASILYLEFGVMVLSVAVIADARAWLLRPLSALARRPSWWAALILVFCKETALLVILTMLGSRGCVQLWLLRQRPDGWLRRLGDEVLLVAMMMGPLVLYLSIRLSQSLKPYGAQWGRLIDPVIWGQALQASLLHIGPLWLAAFAGIVCLWRRKRWALLLVCMVLFLGNRAFIFCEGKHWFLVARYQLWALPPVIVLAWEGMTAMVRRSPGGAALVFLVIFLGNVWMSPLNSELLRAPWGDTEETWNPWRACLRDIHQNQPNAKIVLGNMDKAEYTVSFALLGLDWKPDVRQLRPVSDAPPRINTKLTLQAARQLNADIVILRNLGGDLLDGQGAAGYAKSMHYPSEHGGLTVFISRP